MAVNREIIDVSVRGANKVKGSLKGIGSLALKMGGAFFAAKGIIRGMSTIVDQGSKMKSVEMAFTNMGKSVGFSENSLKKLQDATDGTVSKLDLMTKANNAMALGIVESDEQMANMFDTAQKLGKALGQDTAMALDSLVTGMGRQSKLMLDNLGIMVDTQKSYEDYADSIGKSASALTDSEKKIAFNQAAMAEATRIANAMGEEQLTTADKISKLKNTFVDMAATIGTEAEGVFGSVVDALQGVADKIAIGLDFAKSINWKETGSNLTNNAKVVFEAMKDTVLLVFEFLVQNAKKIIFKIPDAFISLMTWIKDNLWPSIKSIAKTLWDPIVISAKLAGAAMQLKFQETWNDMKQMAVDGINSIIESYNFFREILGFEPIALMMAVDDDNIQETKDKIEGFKQDLLETDIGGAIFGLPEDQVDTLQEFNDAMTAIVTEMADQIIVQDNRVDDNKDRIEKKDAKRKKDGFKLTKEVQAGRKKANDQFVTDLQVAGEQIDAFKKVGKAAAIGQAIRDTYESAGSQFKAFSAAYPAPVGQILGVAAAGAAVAAGLARVQQIKKAQYGADFVTSGPQMLMVGEAGREQVSVTPLEGPNVEGPQGQGITLNISGNVLHESFVEENIIPQIREGLRLGENMGI